LTKRKNQSISEQNNETKLDIRKYDSSGIFFSTASFLV
jgi:hypothetical protein